MEEPILNDESANDYKIVAFAVAALLIVGIFTGVGELLSHLFDDKTPGEVKEYQISDGVSELDIDIDAAEMRIVMSDTLYIESNLRNLTVEERGGKLKIEEKTLFGTNGNDTYLTLYIPDSYTFTNLDIDAGAGRLTAEKLSAESLSLTLGAGEVVINESQISTGAVIGTGENKIELNGGIGKIVVKTEK